MEAWQSRIVAEYDALNKKLEKLAAFISSGSAAFEALHPGDKALLREQRDAMLEYSDLLSMRIERFTEEESGP